MKVNPKGIYCLVPMPIIRTFEQAVYELQGDHFEIAEKITCDLTTRVRQEGSFYQEQRKHEWILNYKEFETQILKAVAESDKSFVCKK